MRRVLATELYAAGAAMTLPPLLASSNVNVTDQLRRRFDEINNTVALDKGTLIGLMVAYTLLIITGTTGNCLVCFIVARKPHMRNPRNAYIVNLAISDLLLCLFTMPFTLLQIALKYWPLGAVMCKLVAALQATSIFVSTISITAISLDRYSAIIHPTVGQDCRPLKTVTTLAMIWLVSLICSVPLFLGRTVVDGRADFEQKIPPIVLQYIRTDMEYCVEVWSMFGLEHGRAIFSGITMLVQYVMPISIVTITYQRICKKLKRRMEEKSLATQIERTREKAERNFKRTNKLLISISLIFGLSWLPLNLVNAFADLSSNLFENRKSFLVVFALCHMVGMSSACSNPLLYGWLNDTFRKEFTELFSSFRCCGKNDDASGRHASYRRPSMEVTNGHSTVVICSTSTSNRKCGSKHGHNKNGCLASGSPQKMATQLIANPLDAIVVHDQSPRKPNNNVTRESKDCVPVATNKCETIVSI
ncbi:Neuropeptide F receptor [Halotydeus destructor]|nr:Neuropeptide F receptor [Halotydeus destructor]